MTNNYDHVTDFLQRHQIKHPYCGASFGPGWTALLDRLVADLKALGWDGDCAQIKEKFGGLRFYIGAATKETFDAIHARIRQAEDESFKTCESCGQTGKLRNDKGWMMTRCDACWEGQ